MKAIEVLTPLILELFDDDVTVRLRGQQIVDALNYIKPDWIWFTLGTLLADDKIQVEGKYNPMIPVADQTWRLA